MPRSLPRSLPLRLLVGLAVLLVLACPGARAAGASPDAVAADPAVRAFRAWAAAWKVPAAALSVRRAGAVVAEASVGFRTARTPVLVGSLSKAVTGVCVAKLVDGGRLSYAARLGGLLPAFFARHPGLPAGARTITVGELLTHASGIAFDPTQVPGEAIDPTRKADAAILAAALSQPLKAKRFAYNNANYAALAMVVEAVTGEDYGRHCARTVLAAAGVRAGLSEDWRAFGAFGGWRMSPRDFARFLDHFVPGSGLIHSGPRDWPRITVPGGGAYSIGILLRPVGDGFEIWHAGAVAAELPGASVDVGAFFHVGADGTAWVAGYQPSPSDAAVADLVRRMAAVLP